MLTAQGEVRLADLGMATRRFQWRDQPDRSKPAPSDDPFGSEFDEESEPPPSHGMRTKPLKMFPQVVTLWYRAPELLLGADTHDEAVDMWAAGCILAELLYCPAGPLFHGEGELAQLSRMFPLLGKPDTESWPDLRRIAPMFAFPSEMTFRDPLDQLFPEEVSIEALDLLEQCVLGQGDFRQSGFSVLHLHCLSLAFPSVLGQIVGVQSSGAHFCKRGPGALLLPRWT